jgi:hypothetical protein
VGGGNVTGAFAQSSAALETTSAATIQTQRIMTDASQVQYEQSDGIQELIGSVKEQNNKDTSSSKKTVDFSE